jgi:hypothetical protein
MISFLFYSYKTNNKTESKSTELPIHQKKRLFEMFNNEYKKKFQTLELKPPSPIPLQRIFFEEIIEENTCKYSTLHP